MKELWAFLLVLLLAAAYSIYPLLGIRDRAEEEALQTEKRIVATAVSQYVRDNGYPPFLPDSLTTLGGGDFREIASKLTLEFGAESVENSFKGIDLKELERAGFLKGVDNSKKFVTIKDSIDTIITVEDVRGDVSWIKEVLSNPQIDLTKYKSMQAIIEDKDGNILQEPRCSLRIGNSFYIGGVGKAGKGMTLAVITKTNELNMGTTTNLDHLLIDPIEVQYLSSSMGQLNVVYKDKNNKVQYLKKPL